jgi:hypothetical protein
LHELQAPEVEPIQSVKINSKRTPVNRKGI